MYDEYHALIKNKSWTLVPRPPDTNIVRCMWLFHPKYLADGTFSHYKARLMANGSTQLEGVDVDETFIPVIKLGTIQTVLSLVASRHWPVHQLDVENAFLHDLVAYSDADWVGCSTNRHSTSGYCVCLGNNLLSWSSKCQPTLSHSSAEAKYRGVSNAVAETCCVRSPLGLIIFFVHDLVDAGQVRVLHVPSCYQFVDNFTKGLPSALFEEFRSSLSVWCPPAPTAREC
nr:ribonuclease H-like domain-containing protein [Tanacetum cinerariifolium]